jgi:hypothetical protein
MHYEPASCVFDCDLDLITFSPGRCSESTATLSDRMRVKNSREGRANFELVWNRLWMVGTLKFNRPGGETLLRSAECRADGWKPRSLLDPEIFI